MGPKIDLCPISSPCKNCEDRFLGCHSQCEKYLAFRKKRDDQLEVINKKKKLEADLDNYVRDSIDKTKKKGRVHTSLIVKERRHRK